MSRDVYVQDIPSHARHVDDIPDDFRPTPIGSRDHIVEVITRVVPGADFSDRTWGTIDGDGYSIEINIRDEASLRSFAFHVRDGTGQADHVIAAILRELGLRAFDPESETGIFEEP